MNQERTENVGLTKAIAIIYLLFGFAWAVAVIRRVEFAGLQLDWRRDIWLPAIIVVAAIGTLRRTKWERWASYFVSSALLLGVPIGTMHGGFMIWHLTKFRNAFRNWY